MGLRICFVTPFAWSQPHEVNEHVAGAAAGLRRLGHTVTILAPSTRARDLLAGRRALQRGTDPEIIAVGPSIPISRRTHLGVPVGVRANLRLALARGHYDVVHGFEPGLPSLSYLALTTTNALTAATFLSSERLGYPARRSRRDRLRIRVDALLATSQETAEAAAERFEGDYHLVPIGIDETLFRPGEKRELIAAELESAGRLVTRALLRELRNLPSWELRLLHTKPLGFRPAIPRSVRSRVRVRAVRRPEQRAAALRDAAIFVPAPGGEERLTHEAAACGAAVVAQLEPDAVVQRDLGARHGWLRPPPLDSRAGEPRGRAELRPRRRRARHDLLGARAQEARSAKATSDPPRGRSARGAGVDRRRPPHAHELVARLLDRGRRPARPRRGDRTRRDRGHRPQRLRRRARSGRARAPSRPLGHPRGRGQDAGPRRGHRPVSR